MRATRGEARGGATARTTRVIIREHKKQLYRLALHYICVLLEKVRFFCWTFLAANSAAHMTAAMHIPQILHHGFIFSFILLFIIIRQHSLLFATFDLALSARRGLVCGSGECVFLQKS